MGLRIIDRKTTNISEKHRATLLQEAGKFWAKAHGENSNLESGFIEAYERAKSRLKPLNQEAMLDVAGRVRAILKTQGTTTHNKVDVATLLNLL